eukprot:UN13765
MKKFDYITNIITISCFRQSRIVFFCCSFSGLGIFNLSELYKNSPLFMQHPLQKRFVCQRSSLFVGYSLFWIFLFSSFPKKQVCSPN